MKESYKEEVANHLGLEPYAVDGNNGGVASARGNVRPAIELRNHQFRVPILSCQGEGKIVITANGKVDDGRGGVNEPVHAWTFQAREPGDPIGVSAAEWRNTAAENGQTTSQTVLLT